MDIWNDLSWLTISEAANFLEVEPKTVRAWLKNTLLLALPHPEDGKLRIPADFLVKNKDYAGPLEDLRGTLMVLADGGFSDEEAINWLFSEESSLGQAPLEALKKGRKKAVRRVAGALAM